VANSCAVQVRFEQPQTRDVECGVLDLCRGRKILAQQARGEDRSSPPAHPHKNLGHKPCLCRGCLSNFVVSIWAPGDVPTRIDHNVAGSASSKAKLCRECIRSLTRHRGGGGEGYGTSMTGARQNAPF
jgi:hypothetical protein